MLTAQWGDYGLPPGKSSFAAHATIAEHYFGGASYPSGGAGAIAAAIVPQIECAGGAVVSRAPKFQASCSTARKRPACG